MKTKGFEKVMLYENVAGAFFSLLYLEGNPLPLGQSWVEDNEAWKRDAKAALEGRPLALIANYDPAIWRPYSEKAAARSLQRVEEGATHIVGIASKDAGQVVIRMSELRFQNGEGAAITGAAFAKYFSL